IPLIDVAVGGTIVTDVSDPVSFPVGLIRIRNLRAVILIVRDTVAVDVARLAAGSGHGPDRGAGGDKARGGTCQRGPAEKRPGSCWFWVNGHVAPPRRRAESPHWRSGELLRLLVPRQVREVNQRGIATVLAPERPDLSDVLDQVRPDSNDD